MLVSRSFCFCAPGLLTNPFLQLVCLDFGSLFVTILLGLQLF
jgi:hypothetical protein